MQCLRMYLGVPEALHRGAKVVVVARLISAVVAEHHKRNQIGSQTAGAGG